MRDYCRSCACRIRLYTLATADGPLCTLACACYQITTSETPTADMLRQHTDIAEKWSSYIRALEQAA